MSYEKIAVLVAIAALAVIYFLSVKKKTPPGSSASAGTSLAEKLRALGPFENPYVNALARAMVYIVFILVFTCLADYFFNGGGYFQAPEKIYQSKFYRFFMATAVIIFTINWIRGKDTLDSYKAIAKMFLPIILLIGVLQTAGCETTIPGIKKAVEERNMAKAARKLEEKKEAAAEKLAKGRSAIAPAYHRLEGKTLIVRVGPDKKCEIDDRIKKGQKFQFLSFDGPFEARIKSGGQNCCWKEIEDNKIKKADNSGTLEVLSGYKEVNLTVVIED